jgi:hypothetical protein
MKRRQDEAAQSSNDRGEDELSTPCIEIMILWGASGLRVAHLAPPRSFYVGEGADPVDVELPLAAGKRWPLVLAGPEGAVDLVVP